MPSLHKHLESLLSTPTRTLLERINIPVTSSSPPGLADAIKEDPWSKSSKYALGWVYFSIILLILTCSIHCYHWWTDKITRAEFKEGATKSSKTSSPDTDYEMANLPTNNSSRKFFPRLGELPAQESEAEPAFSSFSPLDKLISIVRWIVYRPLPVLRHKKREFSFPSIATILIVSIAAIFVTLYCFIPQPLYYASIAFGSPPLAIRAGMLAVAMMPWIVALIPFYVTPIWDQGGLVVFKNYFKGQTYIYGTGIAALIPLLILCVHSLPIFRRKMYELFVALHVPISIIYLGMLFWHCHNYLTSWNYLAATAGIWFLSYCTRLFYLNWTNPRRTSWLIGEEAALTILPENAIKVTIPTQVRWRPGQYVYLRMPGISIFENHPFTIASLCSDDFPSEYSEQYRDMTLVFRPFGGFTRKVLDAARDKGPYKTYRAFIDGPYGGMQRDLASFDTVVLFAGGSGITAIVSQLLDLIKKMRDGKAVTKKVEVVWALKRPETMEWFKEELRICREFAPLETVHCQFYITAAKRLPMGCSITGPQQWPPSPSRPVSDMVHGKINQAFQGIASKRNSALIRDEAGGDAEKEKELRRENEDGITALPQPTYSYPHLPKKRTCGANDPSQDQTGAKNFDFGFPSTPTLLQKNLMRFAFLPSVSTAQKKEGWRTEYGRPDIPFMLRGFEREFGRRTCVFVCGPPGMRRDVQVEVARMQLAVARGEGAREEVYLHTENYAI
ncbi:hypothetical protein G7Y79_00052g087770 [Physcia stellaris]|nr:hypothetical protein G7Y79_00052g087770 [Physcia stellaris]